MHREQKYVSIPTEIEAIQWRGDNELAVALFVGPVPGSDLQLGFFAHENKGGDAHLYVEANKAWLVLELNEWVAKDSLGFYPIKDEAFKKKYRMVNHRGEFVPPYDR